MNKNTVILTHAGADLDAISSMYAAGKLYPGSFLIDPGSMDEEARKMSEIFGDMLRLVKVKEIPRKIRTEIKRVIIVDTKIPQRVGEGREFLKKKDVEIIVFDHHPSSPGDIKNAKIVSRNVGANTTILVNLLKKKKIILSPMEATLLALGIYEDTGSFMFPSVSCEDFEAISFLSSFGINMKIIRSFVSPFLNRTQLTLLKNLLSGITEKEINGVKVAFARAETKKYVQGISVVTHRLREMVNSDLMFVIVKNKEGVFIIGRSNSPVYNVKEILLPFGGGGHITAATAILKEGDPNKIQNLLEKRISEINFGKLTAADIMSSPVKTIDAKTGIKEAYKIMVQFGYSGLPVNEKGRITGIISKRDIEKIMLAEKRNRPVKQYLTPKIVKVKPETTLEKIEEIMAENDVGRVLVAKKGKVIGIISRSDLIKALYMERKMFSGKGFEMKSASPFPAEVKMLMKSRLPEKVYYLLELFGKLSAKNNQQIYLVGGSVRDLFLGIRSLDFDFVLSKDATEFGNMLSDALKTKVIIHKDFGTIHFSYEGYEFDFVTARREWYNKNSILPNVENATLKEDLSRRDFTVNAMAISIMPYDFGRLIDLFNGLKDLSEKTIRVLYPLSFLEDPSRLLRAIKYEAKLGFKLSEDTEYLFKKAVELGALMNTKSQRITQELFELLSETYSKKAINLMEKRGVLKEFFGIKRLSKIKKEALEEEETIVSKYGLSRLKINLFILLYGKKKEEIEKILSGFSVKKKTIKEITNGLRIIRQIRRQKKIKEENVLELIKMPKEITASVLLFLKDEKHKEELTEYLKNPNKLKPEITGKDLKALGLKEGKQFGEILKELIILKLKGKIKTKKDELDYVLQNKERFEWKTKN